MCFSNSKLKKQLYDSLESPIASMQVCKYPSLWNLGLVYITYHAEQKLVDVLQQGMNNNLLFGADDIFDNSLFTKKEYNDPAFYSVKNRTIELVKIITNETLKRTEKLAGENRLSGYFLVDITRSSRVDIKAGTYLCSFDNADNLLLLNAPFISYSLQDNLTAAIFDYRLIKPLIVIQKSTIKDFQTFGTQLMQSTVTGNTTQGKVGFLSTGLSELIFGASYTILKGMSSFTLNTKHEINDIRNVQVVFNDKSDVEFKGITIFFEFNRRMGNIKNKESDEKTIKEKEIQPTTPEKNPSNSSYIQELKDLKELLDSEIITEQEFAEKKKDILAKK